MWSAVLIGIAFWIDGDREIKEMDPTATAPTVLTVRPSCGSETLGQMWPPEANENSRVAKRLAREGLLEVCRWGPWKYSWASPTVHIRQLREIARKKAAR